jgi:long-chain acyl-CoA synthetase
MDPEIINGIQSFGLTFLQGYGLTETSPVVSTNTFFVNVPGTIGIPIKDIEVTIDEPDDDGMGELLVRGDNVMLGYYKNPEETQDVMEKDGWLRTGDLGIIDENGLIKITGRAKSMIVFTNGKKAFPEEYEMLLNSLPGIRDSYVWGYRAPDGDVEVCAKLVIDGEYFNENGFSVQSFADTLDEQIREINKNLPKYKIIRYFVLSFEDLIKTTTLKIKRPLEAEKMNRYLEKTGLDMRKLHKSLIDEK